MKNKTVFVHLLLFAIYPVLELYFQASGLRQFQLTHREAQLPCSLP